MSSEADTPSSTSGDDLDMRPRPFSRVPAEIKALIVAQAARQDQAYKQRLDSAFNTTTQQLVRSGARSWDGRSVNALFCVSREWNALAAPHVFKSITSRRCGDSLFTFSIAIRYAEFVEEAIFSQSQSPILLSKLPAFSNLRHISIDHPAFFTLLGVEDPMDDSDDEADEPSVEQALHRAALKNAITRVPEVSLPDVYQAQLLWILPALGHVKRLSISCYLFDDASKIASARQQLSRLSKVEHLAFTGLTHDSLPLIDSPSTTWAFSAALKSLKVVLAANTSLSDNGWRFIESCSTSLDKLDLTITSSGLAETLTLIRRANRSKGSFPALKHLRLQATEEILPHLLALFASSPVHTLGLAIFSYEPNIEESSLLPLLHRSIDIFSGTLQEIDFAVAPPENSRAYVSPAVHAAVHAELVAVASTHCIALTAGPLYDAFLHPPKPNDPTYISSACDAVDDALRFGLARSARLRETGDVDGVQALLDLLEPLKGESMREKD